jgi:hypothetical protein
VCLAELVRLGTGGGRQSRPGRRSSRSASGVGLLVELFAGVAMVLTWFAGELAF